jgi:folate-binding protein YgfZ
MNADLGINPSVLEFSGPDAVRFLNGQITQDVRKVISTGAVLTSCVTDAKGKLQFRIWIAESKQGGSVLIFCRNTEAEDLVLRLTRYLIADDVEVLDKSAEISAVEYGLTEMDESARIAAGIPKWGAELMAGMLPPEAGLDESDISYHKGCYIGQEVISRIKSAGKVNRILTKFQFQDSSKTGSITDANGKVCGEVTSVCGDLGLGFLKRGAAVDSLSVDGSPLFIRGSLSD